MATIDSVDGSMYSYHHPHHIRAVNALYQEVKRHYKTRGWAKFGWAKWQTFTSTKHKITIQSTARNTTRKVSIFNSTKERSLLELQHPVSLLLFETLQDRASTTGCFDFSKPLPLSTDEPRTLWWYYLAAIAHPAHHSSQHSYFKPRDGSRGREILFPVPKLPTLRQHCYNPTNTIG